jgi:hypothetical protein
MSLAFEINSMGFYDKHMVCVLAKLMIICWSYDLSPQQGQFLGT